MGLNLWLNCCYRGWFHSVFGWVGILVQWVWIYLVMFVFLKKKIKWTHFSSWPIFYFSSEKRN